jgi:hypothetical protein
MNIFRKTAIATALCLINISSFAGSVNASINALGSSAALTISATVTPSVDFVSNNSKLYLAIVQGADVYFYSDTAGFVPYAGGLGVLTSSNPTEAPPVRSITKSTETIALAGDARGVAGADVYVGYGASFTELINNSRYSKLYTMITRPEDCVAPKVLQTRTCVTPITTSVYSSVVNVSSTTGITTATGVIPMDLNLDGTTDLLFFPNTFNTGVDLNSFAIINQSNGAIFSQSDYWGSNFTTGFSKDWWLKDINADGKVDLAWIDHGLELSSGFELGKNAALISTPLSKWGYTALAGDRAFNHGGTLFSQNNGATQSLAVVNFNNSISLYSPIDGNNASLVTAGLNNDFIQSGPSAVTSVKKSDGSIELAVGSYVKRSSSAPSGHIGFYKISNATLIEDANSRFEFPSLWISKNLGAFASIAADFRGVGYDDVIVLGETVDLNNYTRDVIYLEQQSNGKFVDSTSVRLSNILPLISSADKLVPVDINHDGKIDLIGFSWRNGSYANGFGLFVNDGYGSLSSIKFGDQSLANQTNYPIFSTNSDGTWKDLIGIYGVSVMNSTQVRVTKWISNQFSN